jgi:alpha-methylacyl-CoA racemase
VAIGSLEPQFYALLREKAHLKDSAFDDQMNEANWPMLKTKVAAVIRSKTRQEWSALMEGTDACFAPVLSLGEAPLHPHNMARGTFIPVGGKQQPAPAPRFSARPASPPRITSRAGADTRDVLEGLGYGPDQINKLYQSGALGA